MTEADAAEPAPRASAGQVHDLGYQRYVGPRRSPGTRWRVVARQQIATAWKTWWRYKAGLGFAAVITCVFGALMYFPTSNEAFRGMSVVANPDTTLAMSTEWYCRIAFFMSLVLGAGTVAGDVQSGAFTFYFARSVRPRDYVLGKVAGYGVLVASIAIVGPLLLALLRLGISDTTDELVEHVKMVPHAVELGLVIAIPYTMVPLGFSALASDRRTALALWATYYLVFGTVVGLIGRFSGGSIAAFDLPTACLAIAFDLFDAHPLFGRRAARSLPLWAAVISLALHALVAGIILWVRVSRAQKRGVGGAG
ncbi:MAG TPA: ABC transporter permease subunit [Kofleriaceae bacterium]|nr:ABC transporter permease subunit [Kofleriaceae bacterium]